MKDVERKKEKSWMMKHIKAEHKGDKENVKFEWKVTGIFRRPL